MQKSRFESLDVGRALGVHFLSRRLAPASWKVVPLPRVKLVDPRSIMPVSVPSATKIPIQGVALGDFADSVNFEYGEEKLSQHHYDREACGAQLLRLSATEVSKAARNCQILNCT